MTGLFFCVVTHNTLTRPYFMSQRAFSWHILLTKQWVWYAVGIKVKLTKNVMSALHVVGT